MTDRYPASSYRRVFGDSPRGVPGSSARFPGSPARLGGPGSPRGAPGLRSGTPALALYRRSPVRTESLDPVQTSTELRLIRTNEKEQLQGLNDRFAVFIDKVRHLEQQNKALEAELAALRLKHGEPSRAAQLYQEEVRELRLQAEELHRHKDRVLLERNHLEEELREAARRCEEEARARQEAELSLRAFRKDVDEATAVRLDLERRLEAAADEITFLNKLHQEEVQELSAMLEEQQVNQVEVDSSKPDLTSALKEIRVQYESVASKNLQSAEDWYKNKFASLNEAAARSSEVARASRSENADFRRQLQAKSIEIESLRGANETLERQVNEMEEAHSAEIAAMQDSMGHLDLELRTLKEETSQHVRDYQDLLNVKMALDIEIAAYRKLLEGEETHFNSGISFGSASSSYQPRSSAPFASSSFTSSSSTNTSSSNTSSSSRSQRDKDAGKKENLKDAGEDKDEADINSNN